MILTLDEWFAPEEIFERCTPVGIRRECEPETAARLEEKIKLYRERFGKEIPFIENDTVVISSSELRESLRNGCGHGGYLSDEVYEFIKNHQLYGTK
jgi:nicotinic acid mononucleotide adenylyltransferase